jgi:nitrite reductase (NADH) small subunit/3-phenylpropionate/trans-cinnamate dioxygenase ferredoxin subunit
MMASFHTVCRVGDIPEGEARVFFVDGRPIAVFCVRGQYFALDDKCPHGGASLAEGPVEGHTVRCRIHNWRFSIRDGTYLDEPLPEYNAQTHPVRVNDQNVQVQVIPHSESNKGI